MGVPDELLEHIRTSSRLSAAQAQHLVGEVLAYFDETADAFVQRRHAELKAEGLKNPAIFAQLAGELQQRRFRAPALSERQLRRLVYG